MPIAESGVRNYHDLTHKYFSTPMQQFMFYDKYSRWRRVLNRRETWPETVIRVIDFLRKNCRVSFTGPEWTEMRDAMFQLEVMPSMRIIQMGGPALERCHVGAYNCAYTVI